MTYSPHKESCDVFGYRVRIIPTIFRMDNVERGVTGHASSDTRFTFAAFQSLIYLMILSTSVAQKNISHAMQLDVSAMVQVLDLLDEWGTAFRVTDPDNRRANIVTITNEGYCLVEEIIQDIDTSLLKVFHTLSQKESAAVSGSLTVTYVALRSIKSNFI